MPGTRVLLADGTTKDIEDLWVGDTVSADDVESGDTQSRVVTAVHRHAGTKKLVTLTVDTDGEAGDGTATVTSTAAHPYWLPDVGNWVTADKLQPGMWLQTSAGTWVQVTAVDKHTRHQRVHNLTSTASTPTTSSPATTRSSSTTPAVLRVTCRGRMERCRIRTLGGLLPIRTVFLRSRVVEFMGTRCRVRCQRRCIALRIFRVICLSGA